MHQYKAGDEVLVLHNNVFKTPLWYPGVVLEVSDDPRDKCPIHVHVQVCISQDPPEGYTFWAPLYRVQPEPTFEIMGMTNETVKTNHPHS
jgi:hypothetical protein